MDLLLIGLATLLLAPLVYGLPLEPLRIALGLPFVLFFPGYTLLAALFPRRGDLEGVERLALSLGLSLAVVPLVGLALNFTPWGIRLTPTVVSLASLILGLSGLAFYRRRQLSPQERYEPRVDSRPLLQAWASGGRWDRLLTLLLALAILGAVGSLAYAIAKPKVGERFTEFYVLGPSGKAEGYPTRLWVGSPTELQVGIVNYEFQAETYRVEALLAGEVVATTAPITLEADQKWEGVISLVARQVGERQKLELLLYKGPGVEPYRRLHLWVEVRSLD